VETTAYIESGVLELYASGLLAPEEAWEVERMAANNPEIQAELGAIQALLERYAQAHAVAPRVAVRERLMAAVAETPAGKALPPQESAKITALNPQAATPPVAAPRTAVKGWRQYALAASVAALAISGFFNAYLTTRLGDARREIASLSSERSQLASEKGFLQTSYADASSQVSVLTGARTKAIALTGTPSAPANKVMVYWDAGKQMAYVSLQALPPPPDGMQYQLWALMDGKPIDAGVFDYEMDSLQKMKPVAEAQAFAVTLERMGGSPTPTLESICVMGKVVG